MYSGAGHIVIVELEPAPGRQSDETLTATSNRATRLGVSLAPTKQIPIEALVELSQLAERLGYASVWVPETWGSEATVSLTMLASNTERIGIAAGVFNIYSRSAALIAQTTATLQNISNGRFTLGIGTSGPIVVEKWHGEHFRRPIGRTRDYIEVIRLALSGRTVDYTGVDMQLKGFRLSNPPALPVPIYLAALGPRNIRLAGELADGWLPIFAARGHLSKLTETLHEGIRAAGRFPNQVAVAAYIPAALGAGAEKLLRQQIAYYVGGMGTFYADFVSRVGFQSQADNIHRRWQRGDRLGAVAAVDDALLEACTLGPDVAEARIRLEQYCDEGIGMPILVPAHGSTVQNVADTLIGLAPQTSGLRLPVE